MDLIICPQIQQSHSRLELPVSAWTEWDTFTGPSKSAHLDGADGAHVWMKGLTPVVKCRVYATINTIVTSLSVSCGSFLNITICVPASLRDVHPVAMFTANAGLSVLFRCCGEKIRVWSKTLGVRGQRFKPVFLYQLLSKFFGGFSSL